MNLRITSLATGVAVCASLLVGVTPVSADVLAGLGSRDGVEFVSTPTAADTACNPARDKIITIPWPTIGDGIAPIFETTYQKGLAPFTKVEPNFNSQTFAYKITVPSNFKMPYRPNLGNIWVAEWPNHGVFFRTVSISKKPCDFSSASAISPYINDYARTTKENSIAVNFSVGNSECNYYIGAGGSGCTKGINLQPGQTFYVNVKNDPGASECIGADKDCRVVFHIMRPYTSSGEKVDFGESCTNPDGAVVSIPRPGYPQMTETIFGKLCHKGVVVPDCASIANPTNLPAFAQKYCTDLKAGIDNVDILKWSLVPITPYTEGTGSNTSSSNAASNTGAGATNTSSSGATGGTLSYTQWLANILSQVGVGATGGTTGSTGNTGGTNPSTGTSGSTGGTTDTTSSAATGLLTVDLGIGRANPVAQVKILQTFLNREVGSTLPITGYFGELTFDAVMKLQRKYPDATYRRAGLTYATGFVGGYTRELINAILSGTVVSTAGSTGSTGGGTAGTGATSGTVTPPPAPPAVVNYCRSGDQVIPLAWPASGQVRPSTSGLKDQTIAFKITVPYTFNPPLNTNHLGFMRVTEVPGQEVTAHEMTVSRNPCDFQSGAYLTSGIGSGDTSPGVNYTVNNPSGYRGAGGQFNLQSGDIIYANIRNANNGVPSCPDATCDILFDFATPNRY